VILGIGVDEVDVERMRVVLGRTPSVARRLFTDGERAYAAEARDPAERLAVRFAAKEAVLKALGVGLGACRFADIEVLRAEGGAPSLALHGGAASLVTERGVGRWHVSLTHDGGRATAFVIAEA
jgi:holo-[acyl-carrier protein] synthase